MNFRTLLNVDELHRRLCHGSNC